MAPLLSIGGGGHFSVEGNSARRRCPGDRVIPRQAMKKPPEGGFRWRHGGSVCELAGSFDHALELGDLGGHELLVAGLG